MSYRKTLHSDEYRYESRNETTVQYVPPPSPPPRPVTIIRARSPSISSYVRINSRLPRSRSFRQTITRNDNDNVVSIKIESDDNNNRDDTTSLVTYTTTKNDQKKEEIDYKYNYSYKETYETTRNKLSPPQSKSLTQITTTRFVDDLSDEKDNGSVTYVFNGDDNKRQVTFVKHVENDSGLSLPGCLVKASPTFLPVTRSLQLGSIFNGNSFALLTEHLTIKEKFNVSFDFKTTSRNGILMIVVDPSSHDSFFIELYDSQLKATLFINGEPDSCWTDFPSSFLSNDVWVNVNIEIVGKKMNMTVKNELITKYHRHQLLYPIRGDLFIAGHPATIIPPFACRSRDFFIGEMRNFFVNSEGVKWYGVPSYLAPRLRNWY